MQLHNTRIHIPVTSSATLGDVQEIQDYLREQEIVRSVDFNMEKNSIMVELNLQPKKNRDLEYKLKERILPNGSTAELKKGVVQAGSRQELDVENCSRLILENKG